jgi:hypothetical protein
MRLSLACLLACSAFAAATAAPADSAPDLADLSASLRTLLVQSLPQVLYEASPNWGKTSQVPHAVRWRGQGLRVHPEVVKTARNDGTWRKLRVTTQDLNRTVEFRLSDLKNTGPDQMTFNVFLAFQAGVEFEQQIWESGVRLDSGSTRARLRLKLPMVCEATVRVEPGKSLLPDTVFRLRVLKANLGYDNLVVEHIAGIGGTGARWLGEALRSNVKELRPSLERDLLAKANVAILKAGDTREIRIGLGSLIGKR